MRKSKNLTDEKLENLIQKRSRKIDVKKLGNVIIALALFHFAFFGYISNMYLKTPGNNLLFVYQAMFSKYILRWTYLNTPTFMPSYVSLIILLAIGIFQAYQHDFIFYSIKYNFWTVLGIIPMSWLWYSINYQQNFLQVITLYFTSANWNAIALQSTTIGAVFRYIGSAYWLWNFILLEIVYVGAGFLGAYLKSRHFNKIRKQNLEILIASQRGTSNQNTGENYSDKNLESKFSEAKE